MDRPEDAPKAFETAWNAHDMEALGALFHEDATFVNRFGHYVRGVQQIIDLHSPIHATIYSDSTLANEPIDAVPIGDGEMLDRVRERSETNQTRAAGTSCLISAELPEPGTAE